MYCGQLKSGGGPCPSGGVESTKNGNVTSVVQSAISSKTVIVNDPYPD
jgi:hypothetical protein